MRPTHIISGLLLSATTAGLAAQCCWELEAGTGDHRELPHAVSYTALAARSLHIDFEHDVSMISFVDNANFDPTYAIALKPRRSGEWLLAYAIDKGIVRPTPAFRVSVPFSEPLARRVANVWQHAIAEAGKDPTLSCIRLDGKSYAFSAGGRQAHAWEPRGGVPMRLIEVSETLKSIVLETKRGERTKDSLEARLDQQLAGLESELKLAAH